MATSKNTRTPTGHIAPFGLRLQPELKARAEESAARNGRSLNAEIIYILQEYYDLRDYHDKIIDEAIALSPAPVTVTSAVEALTEPALKQLAEFLSNSVAEKLSARLEEQIHAARPIDVSTPRIKRSRPKG